MSEIHRNSATSQTHSQLSLSCQLDQDYTNSEKIEEQFPQTLTVSEAISSKSNGVFIQLSEIQLNLHHWAGISAIQALNP